MRGVISTHVNKIVNIDNPRLQISVKSSVSEALTDVFIITLILIISALVSVRHVERQDDEWSQDCGHLPVVPCLLSKKRITMKFHQSLLVSTRKKLDIEPEREWEDELPEYMRDPETSSQANISPEKVTLCQQVHDLQVEVLARFW